MNNAKLSAIAEKAATDLIAMVNEKHEEITAAWRACEEEAALSESGQKFRLGLSIALDITKNKMEVALSFGLRRKVSAESTIPDPEQIKLELRDN